MGRYLAMVLAILTLSLACSGGPAGRSPAPVLAEQVWTEADVSLRVLGTDPPTLHLVHLPNEDYPFRPYELVHARFEEGELQGEFEVQRMGGDGPFAWVLITLHQSDGTAWRQRLWMSRPVFGPPRSGFLSWTEGETWQQPEHSLSRTVVTEDEVRFTDCEAGRTFTIERVKSEWEAVPAQDAAVACPGQE